MAKPFILQPLLRAMSILALVQSGAFASVCPSPEQGETTQDCPWAQIVRDAGSNAASLEGALQKQAPGFVSSLEKDSKIKALKELWGQSLNFDEFTKAEIVTPSLLEFLHLKFLGAKPSTSGGVIAGHAGLTHTYGYLLSNLKTPYGTKRSRWVAGEIEEGFGLPKGTLLGNVIHPERKDSFLANVTALAGRFAFSESFEGQQLLATLKDHIAPEIIKLPFQKWSWNEIQEEFSAKDSEGKFHRHRLDTLLVKFPVEIKGAKNQHLLIYRAFDYASRKLQLITAFPVSDSFIDSISKTDRFGSLKEIKPQYNIFVPSIASDPHPFKGDRSFTAQKRMKPVAFRKVSP